MAKKNRHAEGDNSKPLFDISILTSESVISMMRNRVIYAIYDNGQIIGSVEISKKYPPEILDLYVLEQYWGIKPQGNHKNPLLALESSWSTFASPPQTNIPNLTALLYTTAQEHINRK